MPNPIWVEDFFLCGDWTRKLPVEWVFRFGEWGVVPGICGIDPKKLLKSFPRMLWFGVNE